MSTPILAVFTDGVPRLVSIDELRELVGVADLQRQLNAYTAVADDRLVKVADIQNQAMRETRSDVVTGFERVEQVEARFPDIEARFDPIETDISAIKLADVGRDVALDLLASVTADQDAAQKQATRDIGRIGDTLLRALMEASRTRAVLRDAGIVVDPTSGVVRIYAVDQIANRTSKTEQTLDAVKGTISQKASVDYVNDAIARAVLDPSQVAQLEPLLARMTEAEIEIDGLNAAVTLAASSEELRALSATVTKTSQTLDALAGTVDTKAEKTVVDDQGIRLAAAETTLSALPDSSGFTVSLRQARGNADGAAEAGLRGLLAGDAASRYQVTQIAQVRQELTARLLDGFGAEASARTQLVVQIGDVSARLVSQDRASVDRDKALTERIDSQGVVLDDQAAAIGRLDTASIDAKGGIASASMTIRQQIGRQDGTDDAILRALLAGDQTNQARVAQIAQVQTQFTTSLVANDAASATARQALLVRMGLAEAAIVSTSQTLADTTQALTKRIGALEAAFSDASTGLVATRARIVALEDATAKADEAISHRLDLLDASLLDPVTGKPVTGATVASDRQARVDADEANAHDIAQLSTQVNDPSTGLLAAYARIDAERGASVKRDEANAGDLTRLAAEVHDPSTGLAATGALVASERDASVKRDEANARAVDQLSSQVNDPATGLPRTSADLKSLSETTAALDSASTKRFESIESQAGDQKAAVKTLQEAIVGPDGQTEARAVLKLTAGGRVSGTVATNDGKVSTFAVSSDRFAVVDPDTDAVLFYVDKDGAVVGRLRAGSIETGQLAAGASSRNVVWMTAADIVVPSTP